MQGRTARQNNRQPPFSRHDQRRTHCRNEQKCFLQTEKEQKHAAAHKTAHADQNIRVIRPR